MTVDLFKQQKPRDKQRKVGASNLSNGCDYHLALDLLGTVRSPSVQDRAFMGRNVGDAIDDLLSDRFEKAKSILGSMVAMRYPDTQIQDNFPIGVLGTYGEVRSTTDWFIPSARRVGDWKNTLDAKLSIIMDAWEDLNGRPARFGRLHKSHKQKTLSEAAYAKEIEAAKYKIETYLRQITLYGRGKAMQGYDVETLCIVFISRDNTGWFDNPAFDGYDDPSKLHAVEVIPFWYDPEFAEAVWERGLSIWEALENGADAESFERHPLCWACSVSGETAKPALDNVVTIGGVAA